MQKKVLVIDSLNMYLPCLPSNWVHSFRVLYSTILLFIRAASIDYKPFFVVDLSKADAQAKRVWVHRQSRLAVADNRRFPSCSGIIVADVLDTLHKQFPSWFEWSYVTEGTADDMIASIAQSNTGIVLSNDRDFFKYEHRVYKIATRYHIDRSFIIPHLRLFFDERSIGPMRVIPDAGTLTYSKDRAQNDINLLRSGNVHRGVTHPKFRSLPLMHGYLVPVLAALYKVNDIQCTDCVLVPTDKRPFYVWDSIDVLASIRHSQYLDVYECIVNSGGTTAAFVRGCNRVIREYVRDVSSCDVDLEDIANSVLTLALKCTDAVILNETLRPESGCTNMSCERLSFNSKRHVHTTTWHLQNLSKSAWAFFPSFLQMLV